MRRHTQREGSREEGREGASAQRENRAVTENEKQEKQEKNGGEAHMHGALTHTKSVWETTHLLPKHESRAIAKEKKKKKKRLEGQPRMTRGAQRDRNREKTEKQKAKTAAKV